MISAYASKESKALMRLKTAESEANEGERGSMSQIR